MEKENKPWTGPTLSELSERESMNAYVRRSEKTALIESASVRKSALASGLNGVGAILDLSVTASDEPKQFAVGSFFDTTGSQRQKNAERFFKEQEALFSEKNPDIREKAIKFFEQNKPSQSVTSDQTESGSTVVVDSMAQTKGSGDFDGTVDGHCNFSKLEFTQRKKERSPIYSERQNVPQGPMKPKSKPADKKAKSKALKLAKRKNRK